MPFNEYRLPRTREVSQTHTSVHVCSDGRRVLNLSHYIPHFVGVLEHALAGFSAENYRKRFGVGITDWRLLSMLAISPEITAADIQRIIRLDKSVISRGLARFYEQGWALCRPSAEDARSKHWRLSTQGVTLHEQMIDAALEREQDLLAGLSEIDLATFRQVTLHILSNADRLAGASPLDLAG